MVLKIFAAAVSTFFPFEYLVHIIVAFVTLLVLRAYSQGRRTNRERDLHARVILVTGGFTSLGLTLLESLAQRGAHIIALSPHPIDSPQVSVLVTLLRSTTSNEQIFVEQCDLASPASIRSFCTRFLTGSEQRLDAIVYAHEYQQIGSLGSLSHNSGGDAQLRESRSLATFLLTTLLLPALLVAPVERDIRIINVINPFYAAAAGPAFNPISSPKPKPRSIFLMEGTRALRSSILFRHLQRILDALPVAQVPKTDDNIAVPVVNPKVQKSNIAAVTVSPGISRSDTIAPLLNAEWIANQKHWSPLGVTLYIILQPILRILTKSPGAAIQTILHVLFLPTPFKVLSKPTSELSANKGTGTPTDSEASDMPEEVLKLGALYSDCAAVNIRLTMPTSVSEVGLKEDNTSKDESEGISIPDDGELGGELAGRLVWEAFEDELKAWEKTNPAKETPAAPDVDVNVEVEDQNLS